MENPHPTLAPLLDKYDIDWATFSKKGRPAPGVREKRSAIVTELHQRGLAWKEMEEVTGLGNASIQRLTQAKGCAAVRAKRKAVGRAAGLSVRGRKRPWLTEQLKRQWEDGVFDFHKGRVRPEAEREILRASWTPERRARAGESSRQHVWGDPAVRERLLEFHQDPEERARRSRAQAKRMRETPSKYLRGRARWVDTPKGTKERAWVRSSYEAAAVALLESCPEVVWYEHERHLRLPSGRYVLPDFIVGYQDGSADLIEVKAAWVLELPPGHRVSKRLQISRDLAAEHGWGFIVWTEQELGDALRHAA